MKIRRAGSQDNKGLCRVDSLCTQGKGLVFHYQRQDFFLRSRLYDRWAVYLAEEEGAVVGSISACVKKVALKGAPVDVGYFFELRVHPGHRRKGIATALARAAGEYFLREGAQYAYTYVLGSNRNTMAMARKMGMFMAAPFRVYFLSALQGGREALRITAGPGLEDALTRAGEWFKGYDLSEPVRFVHRHIPPSSHGAFRGIFRLPGGARAQACLWDSSVLSAKVVDRVPLPLRFAAALPAPLRRRLGLPEIPNQGEPLRMHHLFDVIWEDEREAAGLIKAVRSRAGREGGQIVMCHLDARDPLGAVVKAQAFHSMDGAILLRTPVEGEKPPPVSLAYLDIRDF